MTLIALHFPSMTASPPRHGGRHTHTEGATPSGQGSAFMRQSARGVLQVSLSGVSAEAVQRRPQPLRLSRARGMVLARLHDGLRLRLFDERRVAEAASQRIPLLLRDRKSTGPELQ